MFSIEQIESAHSKVKSGEDFPKYIRELKAIGVCAFETWVADSHTECYGRGGFQIRSEPKYESLNIAALCDKGKFEGYLHIHQKGETDYFSFCRHCAETGIEKWKVDLDKMTCVYYDLAGNKILSEKLPED